MKNGLSPKHFSRHILSFDALFAYFSIKLTAPMKNTAYYILVLAVLITVASCSPKVMPYAATNKVYNHQTDSLLEVFGRRQPAMLVDSLGLPIPSEWIGTVNFNARKPNYVIIHYTAQDSLAQTIKTFTLVKPQVSAHYVVGKDGKVVHMLNDYLRAWQAGVSKWGNMVDINSSSIGIEIDNNGFEPFTDAQVASLLRLLARLKREYSIPAANFIGHSDIAPGRKVDPNRYFPWQTLASQGFGLWYDTTGLQVPEGFNAVQGLRIIGYNVKDSMAAIGSFKLHFVQQDSTKVLTDDERKIIYDLMNKYQ